MRRQVCQQLFALLTSFALLLAAGSRAGAQAVVPDAEQAYEAALDRALSSHASGDFTSAERAMREAHALSPSARTYRGLGVILYAQGRYLEAVEALEQALASRERPLESERRAGAEELLARVFQRIGRLSLRIEPSESALRIDGRPPELRADAEILLTPGEHRIEIEAPGYEPYALRLSTKPGSRDSLHVVLARERSELEAQPAARLPLSGAESPQAEAVSRGPARWWQPLTRNSVLGAGALVTLTGGSIWLVGYLRYRSLYNLCKKSCDETEHKERFEDKKIGPLTATGAGLAIAGVAVLAVAGSIELWQHRERKRVRVALSPTELQLSATF